MIRHRVQLVWGLASTAVLCLVVFRLFAPRSESFTKSDFEKLLNLSQGSHKEHHSSHEFSKIFDSFEKMEKFLHVEESNEIGLGYKNCSSVPIISVIVFSSPYNEEQRSAIRSTWASSRGSIVKTQFLIGTNGLKVLEIGRLQEEQGANGDILFGDFVDSYANLTVKAMSMLAWANRTPNVSRCPSRVPRFLMKADDDTFVNVEEVVRLLTGFRDIPLAIGSVVSGAEGIPGPAWSEDTSEYDTYPDYLSGSVYILTMKAVQEILVAAGTVRPFWLEDVFVTGILTKIAGVPLLNNDNFQPFASRFDPCSGQISCHKVDPKRMKLLHSMLSNGDKYCKFVRNNGLY